MRQLATVAAVLLVALVAIGQLAPKDSVQVSPRNVSFGEIKVGQVSNFAELVTIKNTGVTADALSITSNNPQFEVEVPSCGLLAGQSCVVTILFRPNAVGHRSGVVIVTDLNTQQSTGVNVTGMGTD